MKEINKGYLDLIIFSVLAGVVGVIVKMIEGMDFFSILFFRGAIAAVFIFAIVLIRRKLKELKIVDPVRTISVGLLQSASMFCYFNAIILTSVSNAVFLLYTAPIFSVIFAKIFFKEEIERRTIFGIFITLLGIIFIMDPISFSFESSQTIGNLFGLCSGFFYAAKEK